MLQIHSVELTNICRFACDNCPSSASKYPRGIMTLETFDKVAKIISESPAKSTTLCGFGEELKHPQIEEMFDIIRKYDISVTLITDGTLLTSNFMWHACRNNLNQLEINIHSEESFAAYKKAYWFFKAYFPNIPVIGNILENHVDSIQEWAAKTVLYLSSDNKLRIVKLHNWAQNERDDTPEEVHKWQSKCWFINTNRCVVRWDGNIYSCAVDSEGVNLIGHIDDFENLKIDRTTFKLCHKCSSSWYNGEISFFEYPIA